MPYTKNKISVTVPHKSGFDKSHRSSGTSFCGTLTPLMCDEVIPGSRVSLRLPISVQLPPLVSQTYMNVKYKVEAFFVPSRLLCKSFEDFFVDFPKRVINFPAVGSEGGSAVFSDVRAALPVYELASTLPSSVYGPGSLLDYLGYKIDNLSYASRINPLPLICYHFIWQEMYRNPRVQNPAFAPDLGITDTASYNHIGYRTPCLPYIYFHRDYSNSLGSYQDNTIISVSATDYGQGDFNLADGTSIFALRQRNFGLDYFTGARVSAQQGNPSYITFTTNVTGTDDGSGNVTGTGSGSVSISAIRAANSLQQFRERENAPSPRLVDQVKARYGANLSDGVAQRPICIGTASYDVVSRGVDQTAPIGVSGSGGANPFNGVGSEYGKGAAAGNDFIIDDFTASEPGYIMVLGSLVPEVTYSTGISPLFRRYLTDGSITDMACALLQNVGDQPIFDTELYGVTLPVGAVFGYTDRYADFMFKPNECHGLFRDGQSLSSFILQRSFSGPTTLSSSFLEIPKNYLDGVLTVPSSTSGLSYWYDSILEYKVSMPLAEYSIPSLQDPAYEHGKPVMLRRNGQIF